MVHNFNLKYLHKSEKIIWQIVTKGCFGSLPGVSLKDVDQKSTIIVNISKNIFSNFLSMFLARPEAEIFLLHSIIFKTVFLQR